MGNSGVALRGTSISTRGGGGSRNTPCFFMLLENGDKPRLDGPVGSYVIYSQKCHL